MGSPRSVLQEKVKECLEEDYSIEDTLALNMVDRAWERYGGLLSSSVFDLDIYSIAEWIVQNHRSYVEEIILNENNGLDYMGVSRKEVDVSRLMDLEDGKYWD